MQPEKHCLHRQRVWYVQRIESSTKTWLFPLQYAFWIETNQPREGSRTFDPFQLKALKEVCSCQFKGLFTWREEDPSTWKILEGETTFRLVYMQKYRSG